MRLIKFQSKSILDERREESAAEIHGVLADPAVKDFVFFYRDSDGRYCYEANTVMESMSIYQQMAGITVVDIIRLENE